MARSKPASSDLPSADSVISALRKRICNGARNIAALGMEGDGQKVAGYQIEEHIQDRFSSCGHRRLVSSQEFCRLIERDRIPG
jgi:hypothetical protein